MADEPKIELKPWLGREIEVRTDPCGVSNDRIEPHAEVMDIVDFVVRLATHLSEERLKELFAKLEPLRINKTEPR